jgi:RNA polymerase sigma factor (sigma-70 family)
MGDGLCEDETAQAVASIGPVVDAILARACRTSHVRPEDADDLRAAVMLRLVRRLRAGGVVDLDAYAATLTRNILNDFYRALQVERTRRQSGLHVEGAPFASDDSLADSSPSQLERFERQEHMARLWSEIAILRPLQRAALLLNLRDHLGKNALLLFLLLAIADFDALAEAVGMGADELTQIWNDLPLDDLTIAARLGVTRQQVINLRKSARERLSRRLQEPR